MLPGLLITKALIWAIALGSGTSGGVLAPLLIMGGALGALEVPFLPAWAGGGAGVGSGVAGAALWPLVSMGALMGGTMRSPFTAVAFMLELTHDVDALPALFVACLAADAVTVLLMKRSILTEKVARRGTHLVREYMVNPLHTLRVADVMETSVATVPASFPLERLFRQMADLDPVIGRHHAWPLVDDDGCLVGIITRSDLVRAIERPAFETETVLQAGTSNLVVTYPDELLQEAATKMQEYDLGRLPVVRRESPRQMVGYLGRSALMKAWMSVLKDERDREPGWLTPHFEGLKGRWTQWSGGDGVRRNGH
jgi:CBS domain-containing protein